MVTVTPLTPPEAVDFIIGWEVTSRSVYEKRYAKPTWPGGESGATIGVGYDLAHHDADDLALDWPTLAPAARSTLATACGKAGQAAKALIPSLASVTVPWDAAYQCFRDRSLPKYERQAADAFGGCLDLPPLCFGALVSLVYNRGASMAGDGRVEMRAIRDLIAAGKLDDVPYQIRAMKRLWPTVEGLQNRREAEAVMWERGLST